MTLSPIEMEREYNEYVVSLEIVETSSERRQDWAWNREELAKTDGQGGIEYKGNYCSWIP